MLGFQPLRLSCQVEAFALFLPVKLGNHVTSSSGRKQVLRSKTPSRTQICIDCECSIVMYGLLIDKGSTMLGVESGLQLGTRREHSSQLLARTLSLCLKDTLIDPRQPHADGQRVPWVFSTGREGIDVEGVGSCLQRQTHFLDWSRSQSNSTTSPPAWVPASSNASLICMAAPKQAFRK